MTVTHHFSLLKSTMEEKDIPWDNIYNMDKKGIQLRGGQKGAQIKYFFNVDDKMMYRLQSDDLEVMTIIDCVCADGTSGIRPCFVFSGVKKAEEWFNKILTFFAIIANSMNGWTDNEIGFHEPQVKEKNMSGKPILLIYENHGSHTLESWAEYGFENNIVLYCLPPHTTH
ncbi:hypothetical protein K435DRAFT_821393 [Dendrothele bispora CBS 962.96]|uniref:DDE-1 domain-containing protein n=1 Tax=Dendrothele bispora (strain CBS 962.96) TaxID=1314807 RepID=A0A4S8LKA2_DENBC|nr:hypothetical protein K435DRAFT_821393 [Dendrothele bispora CBS 962.96]